MDLKCPKSQVLLFEKISNANNYGRNLRSPLCPVAKFRVLGYLGSKRPGVKRSGLNRSGLILQKRNVSVHNLQVRNAKV